jgi:predicted acyl esterase
VDEASNIILSAAITTNAIDDAAMLLLLITTAKESCCPGGGIKQCSSDGAYDKMKCYDALDGIRATIPARKDAKIHRHGNRKAVAKHPRDENIRAIRKQGRKAWKKGSGYHRRSKAEVAMFRYKTIFGGTMNAREMERQKREGQIKCRILNLMTHNGMPTSVPIVRKAAEISNT